MRLNISINYHTNWGESLKIVGSLEELGAGDESKALKMLSEDGSRWSIQLNLPDNSVEFTYNYIVVAESGYVRHEWGPKRTLSLNKRIESYEIRDAWQNTPIDKPLYSSAFTDGIFSRIDKANPLAVKGGTVTIKVFAPLIDRGQALAISGSSNALGNWDPAKAIEMNDSRFPEWSVVVDVNKATEPVDYKFLIIDKATRAVVAWEDRDNRTYTGGALKRTQAAVEAGLVFHNPLPRWRGAGVAIPVFSLRSDEDFGVGDFYDMKKMVDWAEATGQKVLQILPINDTTMTHTWTDSYPYNANSTFALHPMFLRPDAIGELSDKAKEAEYRAQAAELNALAQIDYERVNNVKTAYVHDLFVEHGATTAASTDFKEFVARNEYWLKPYAAFCVLRDEKGTPDFKQWGKYSTYDEVAINALAKDREQDILFVYYQQYHLDKQLREARDYAHAHGVVIKGDIPIGISRTSVDAWVNPRLFNMDSQAGAPPDDFSVMGQNWGFPTYNWEEMNKDGFTWWKNRLRKMSEYFDAYRIDHILGFFRIWQIPMSAVHGLLGAFNPAMPYSAGELQGNYDFWINKYFHTVPYIKDYMLGDFFGEFAEEVKSTYLYPKDNWSYGLQEFVDTQRKVEDYFADKEKDYKNERIKNGLLGLLDEVLFIPDPEYPETYHPRISAQFTYAYRALNDYEKWCFNRLYNDFFYHRHNDFWYGKAMWKLPPLLDATGMLACGEDLGMIPDCVASVMSQLQILSLEIQRMPKDPKAEFGDTWSYPYYSVCTTSTHDMPGIRAWWESDRDKTQHFYNNVLHEGGAAPYFAEPWICDRIVTAHLQSPSILAILPLQDYLSIHGTLRRENPNDEQINIPAISRHYWRYRMHLTLETLNANTEFNEYLRDKIKGAGR